LSGLSGSSFIFASTFTSAVLKSAVNSGFFSCDSNCKLKAALEFLKKSFFDLLSAFFTLIVALCFFFGEYPIPSSFTKRAFKMSFLSTEPNKLRVIKYYTIIVIDNINILLIYYFLLVF